MMNDEIFKEKMDKMIFNAEHKIEDPALTEAEFMELTEYAREAFDGKNDSKLTPQDLIPLFDAFQFSFLGDDYEGKLNRVEIDYIMSKFDKRIKSRSPTKNQLKHFVSSAMVKSGFSEEAGAQFGKQLFGGANKTRQSGHTSTVTKYDKFPPLVKDVYLQTDRELKRIEELRINNELTNQDAKVLAKDVKLASELDAFVATVESNMQDKHLEKLSTGVDGLTIAVSLVKSYVNQFTQRFETLLVTSNSKQEVREGIDSFVKSFEKGGNVTFEQVSDQVFRLKRDVEKQLADAMAISKKEIAGLTKARKNEIEIITHRTSPITQEVFEKYGSPLDSEDFVQQDWFEIEQMILTGRDIVDECKKQFDESHKEFRKAKSDYDTIIKRVNTYFDPRNNNNDLPPFGGK